MKVCKAVKIVFLLLVISWSIAPLTTKAEEVPKENAVALEEKIAVGENVPSVKSTIAQVAKGLLFTLGSFLIGVSIYNRLLGRKSKSTTSLIREVDRARVSQQGELLLFEVQGERVLLSRAKDEINFLCKLNQKENCLDNIKEKKLQPDLPSQSKKAYLAVRQMSASFCRIAVLLLATVGFADFSLAQENSPSVTINTMSGSNISSAEIFTGLKLALMVSALVYIPSMVMTMTCFTRIAIILAMTRQALSTAQTPPNQIIIGLSLFLTFAIMAPVFEDIYENSLLPYSEDKIGHMEALNKAFDPLKGFMLRHTREQDLALFVEVQKKELPETPEALGPTTVIPAFLLSELNSAFQIAFLIYLPFLILDMIISSVLTSMSMITLPPTVISLPIKLMLFVVIDGWHLIIGNVVNSYQV